MRKEKDPAHIHFIKRFDKLVREKYPELTECILNILYSVEIDTEYKCFKVRLKILPDYPNFRYFKDEINHRKRLRVLIKDISNYSVFFCFNRVEFAYSNDSIYEFSNICSETPVMERITIKNR